MARIKGEEWCSAEVEQQLWAGVEELRPLALLPLRFNELGQVRSVASGRWSRRWKRRWVGVNRYKKGLPSLSDTPDEFFFFSFVFIHSLHVGQGI